MAERSPKRRTPLGLGDRHQRLHRLLGVQDVDHLVEALRRGDDTDLPGAVRVSIAAGSRGGTPHVVVRVSDTGCGVPEAALPRLFEPFFQVPSPSHVGKGSGLGLAPSCRPRQALASAAALPR